MAERLCESIKYGKISFITLVCGREGAVEPDVHRFKFGLPLELAVGPWGNSVVAQDLSVLLCPMGIMPRTSDFMSVLCVAGTLVWRLVSSQ